MGSHRNNLQKGVFFWFVKDMVISVFPNSPNNRANAHSNLNKIILRNTLEPIPKRFIAILVPPSQINFSQYHFAMNKPHEDLDLQGYFNFPNIFLKVLRVIIYKV
jgi:hypothetical protein